MSYEENLVNITRPAGADLSAAQYHVVALDGSGNVVLAVAGQEEVLGILQNNPKSGVAATVAISGISKVHAMAATAAGLQVGVGAVAGQVEVAALADVVIGTLIEGVAAANDYAVVAIKIGDKAI